MAISIEPAREAHLPAILAIHNDAVLTTTAIWDETPVDLENRRALLSDRHARGYPFLVALEDGAVLAYASFGDFRAWAGYRHTVEHSVYVHRDHRGRGVARLLLPPLVEAARRLDKHVMIAGIEAANEASLKLHARFGFREAGRLPEVGTKFGRWLDLVFLHKRLDAPA
ncbi:MAG TPA: GNAT family N-acetyltransferase [Beijerinckiaceae bacterium]|jgi:phosphinothricin acetyltransferase